MKISLRGIKNVIAGIAKLEPVLRFLGVKDKTVIAQIVKGSQVVTETIKEIKK